MPELAGPAADHHSMLPKGAYYTSQDLSVKSLRPVTVSTGRLRCEGTVIHLGYRTAFGEARLSDGPGKLYARPAAA